MCSFERNFPFVHPMPRVSTKLYQLRDVRTCKFSLKRRISALVCLRGHLHVQLLTYVVMWTCLSGKFPLFCPLRTDYEVCSLRNNVCLHNFSTYENMHMCNNYHHTVFSTYLPFDILEFSYHHVTFLLTNPFPYPTINIRNHV